MTSEELARALGCTPDTASLHWGTYVWLGTDDREEYCMLPDPFDETTPPEALNRWLEWAVQWLAGRGCDLCVSRCRPKILYYWCPATDIFGDEIDDMKHEHPGAASIAACVALLEKESEGR